MKQSFGVRQLAASSVIAAIYFVLAYSFQPIMFGPLQLRIPEAMTVLPFIAPYTMFGLFVGCLLSNIIGGFGLPDIIFGSFATLLAGFLTSKIKIKWLAPIPPIVINMAVLGLMFAIIYSPENIAGTFPVYAMEIGVGQFGACYLLGMPLLIAFLKIKPLKSIFLGNKDLED